MSIVSWCPVRRRTEASKESCSNRVDVPLEMYEDVDWKCCSSCLCIYVVDPRWKDVTDPQVLLSGSPGFLLRIFVACCMWRYCISKFPCGCINRMGGWLSFGVNSKYRRIRGLMSCVDTCSRQTSVLGIYPLVSVLTWRFDCDLLEKQNGNKWGFSIFSCGPQNYFLLWMFGTSDDILLS